MPPQKRPAAPVPARAANAKVRPWPKITLEFDLADFRLVESLYDPGPEESPNLLPPGPFLCSNKAGGHVPRTVQWGKIAIPLNRQPLKWKEKGLRALVFAFVRAKLLALDKQRSRAIPWTVLEGQNGSPAFVVGGLFDGHSPKVWARNFCGGKGTHSSLFSYGDSGARILDPQNYTAAKGGGSTASVTVQFNPSLFDPDDITINISTKKMPRPASPKEVRQIATNLYNLKDWCEAKDNETPPDGPGDGNTDEPSGLQPDLSPATSEKNYQDNRHASIGVQNTSFY